MALNALRLGLPGREQRLIGYKYSTKSIVLERTRQKPFMLQVKFDNSSISTVALLPSGQAETESVTTPSFDAGSLSVVGPIGTSPTEAQFISQASFNYGKFRQLLIRRS
jgi:hypothetical protein